jgi:hypothetical protein
VNSLQIDVKSVSDFYLAQTIDNLGGKCAYCDHIYESIKDVKARKPKIVRVREFGIGCACKKCYEEKNK